LPSSGTVSYGYNIPAESPSATTAAAIGYQSKLTTAAASFTLGTAAHFFADPTGKGAGSTITNQMGFYAESTLTGATNNYGFYSNIASGSNRWNFYANGSAANYFAGRTAVGTTQINDGYFHALTSENAVVARIAQGASSGTTSDILQVTALNQAAGTGYHLIRCYTSGPTVQFAVRGDGAVRINNSLGVGTDPSGTAGEIRATNNITAYYSDARLKDFKGKIGDALYKVSQLNGYYYTENEKAEEFGYNNKELQVGVSAQEVKAILPEVIAPAPFDMDAENKSKSGENYMTVRYEKLVPLLIEAIKELKAEVEALKAGK
jgi:hypothetical protein